MQDRFWVLNSAVDTMAGMLRRRPQPQNRSSDTQVVVHERNSTNLPAAQNGTVARRELPAHRSVDPIRVQFTEPWDTTWDYERIRKEQREESARLTSGARERMTPKEQLLDMQRTNAMRIKHL